MINYQTCSACGRNVKSLYLLQGKKVCYDCLNKAAQEVQEKELAQAVAAAAADNQIEGGQA